MFRWFGSGFWRGDVGRPEGMRRPLGPPVSECTTFSCQTSTACRMQGAGSRSGGGQSSTPPGHLGFLLAALHVVQLLPRTLRLGSTRSGPGESHRCTCEGTCAALASASRHGCRHHSERRAVPARGGRTAYSELEPRLHRKRPRVKHHRSCRGRWPPHAPTHGLGHLAKEALDKHDISRER